MQAMVMERPARKLAARQVVRPEPGPGQILIKIAACGVCRTDLHVLDGELQHPRLPLVPGHEIVGRVAALGDGVERFGQGQRVGVPWLGWTCGLCDYCRAGRENLCPQARFTGYQLDGGYAEYAVADQRYCFPIPDAYGDAEAAPLLCAGLIGYRAFAKAGEGRRIGIYGFGAAAHIVAQIAVHDGRSVFAFTRAGDEAAQDFARSLGAIWAGSSEEAPPERLDAALIFAPVGALVPAALRALRPGGRVVCAGIHMSPIPSFPYDILWQEREIVSVANLTRADGEAFLALAPRVPVRTHVVPYPLARANEALEDLRHGRLQGAAVLTC
ncbi:MAG: zinc-dependent alcohol dehydrogenase family protein [Reyranellaceae bacterium]